MEAPEVLRYFQEPTGIRFMAEHLSNVENRTSLRGDGLTLRYDPHVCAYMGKLQMRGV